MPRNSDFIALGGTAWAMGIFEIIFFGAWGLSCSSQDLSCGTPASQRCTGL